LREATRVCRGSIRFGVFRENNIIYESGVPVYRHFLKISNENGETNGARGCAAICVSA